METVFCLQVGEPASKAVPRATLWISLGCNIAGPWGTCSQTLARALNELQAHKLLIVACSRIYRTRPVGLTQQPPFLNAVVGLSGSSSPGMLLRLAKRIERQAGRRGIGPRGGPRPLDVDVLDFNARQIGRKGSKRVAGQLLLPHPELTRRGFVLVPLAEVAPGWRHPRLRLSALALLKRHPGLRRGVVALG